MSPSDVAILSGSIAAYAIVTAVVWMERTLVSSARYGEWGKDSITRLADFLGALVWPVLFVLALIRDARRRLRTPGS